jgi:hypothetical protein
LSPAQKNPNDQHDQDLREPESAVVPVVVPSSSESDESSNLPPDLARVVTAWPFLSETIKSAIQTLCQAEACTERQQSLDRALSVPALTAPARPHFSQSIDWYSDGESRTIFASGVQITVRFISRKGRRARIAISGPAGAVFRVLDYGEKNTVL